MDFSYSIYEQLLKSLFSKNFSFIKFGNNLCRANPEKFIILRHDVELRYENAFHFAKIQNKLGIVGTYFFRILPNYFNPEIVKQIADFGHEIGYHYDDLTECKGDYEKAIYRFEHNLSKLRKIAPVNTICMDGSPLSKFDNRDIWKQFNYHNYGIIGEPYFDVDFNEIFYLTDTGRRWDGWKVSVRDKVPQQKDWIEQGLVFHSTHDIINAAKQGKLPDKIMMTFHPQRWHEGGLPWLKELVVQNLKNQVKRVLLKRRSGEMKGLKRLER